MGLGSGAPIDRAPVHADVPKPIEQICRLRHIPAAQEGQKSSRDRRILVLNCGEAAIQREMGLRLGDEYERRVPLPVSQHRYGHD